VEAVGSPHPAKRRARVLRCAPLSKSAFEIELERPADFLFEAGQSIRVYIGGESRDYSLAGSPSVQTLLLVVRRIAGGAVSPALAAASPGSSLDFTGPHGVFTLKPSPRLAVLVATGVGIAPFLSMVRGGATGFTLLHGVRSVDELFYRRELEVAAARYAPCLSRRASPGCFAGRVIAWARDHLSTGGFDFYLCGARAMVRDMILLVDERFPGSRVYTEIFF
jgi:benzoate/toluate 1,2-dioxygenase reductase subunit